MEIYKKKDKIIFEIDYWHDIYNPYSDKIEGKHPTLMGIIYKDDSGDEQMGFAQLIDRSYRGKAPDNTGIMVHCWDREKNEFIELCNELEIDVFEYPTCAYCGKTIYGSCTMDEKGCMCLECEKKKLSKNKKVG